MLKYVVKRVFLAIITLLIICAITFFAMNAIPGGPFDGERQYRKKSGRHWREDTTWINRYRSSLCSI